MEHEVAKLYNEAQEECQAKNSNHPKHESIKFINSLAACVFPLPQWLCFNNSIRPHLFSRFAMAPDTTTLVKPNRCTFATNASWTAQGCWFLHCSGLFMRFGTSTSLHLS